MFVFGVAIFAVRLFAVDACDENPLDLFGLNGTFLLLNNESNRDWQWQLHGNIGFKLMVKLVIQNGHWRDFVTFRDRNSSGPIIVRLSVSGEIHVVVSCSRSLFVRHSNDYGASNLTFTASFKCIGK